MTFFWVLFWCVVVFLALLGVAILVGRKISSGNDSEPDDQLPMASRLKPLVPEQWRPTDEQLRDIPPE